MIVEGLVPVSARSTVQDVVYRQLRHALMTGRFDPGQGLTITAPADPFGPGHIPTGGGSRRLAAANALEIAANGSARVPSISLERLNDLCRARVTLEGLAAELAVPHIRADDIAQLGALVVEHEATARRGSVVE